MSSCHGHSRAPPQERSPGAAARASVAELEPMARQLTAWLLPGVCSCCCPGTKQAKRALWLELAQPALSVCPANLPSALPVPDQLSARPRPVSQSVPNQLSARPRPALSPSPTSSQPVPNQLSARPHPALSPSPISSQPVPDQLSARPPTSSLPSHLNLSPPCLNRCFNV